MKKLLLFSILLLSVSCEKAIDLNLKTAPPKLVVDAVLSNDTLVSFIRVSLSEDLSLDESSFNNISTADIRVTDDQGNEIVFQPYEGIYKTDTPAVPGRIYHIQIDYQDYHVQAQNRMLTPINLQDVQVIYETDAYGTHHNFRFLFEDPNPNVVNYYIIRGFYYLHGVKWGVSGRYLFSDLDYNVSFGGIEIKYSPIASTGSKTEMKVFHIDKQSYDFYKTMKKINNMRFGSSPFVTAVPGNPNFNIENGIGFFSCQSAGSGITIPHPN